MFVSLDPAKLLLSHQQAGARPALSLIAGMPPLHVGANPFDDRERRLDDVGAGQRLARLWGNVEPMQGQRFLQSLTQAPGRTRIQIHQFAMQRAQRLLGRVIVFQSIGGIQFPCHQGSLFVGQVVQHVARLCT